MKTLTKQEKATITWAQQNDGLNDARSSHPTAVIDFTEGEAAEVLVRREFAPQCDTEFILKQHGVPANQGGWYGEVDFDLDLQRAMIAIEMAERAHSDIGDQLRAKYPTWMDFINAVHNGELLQAVRDDTNRRRAIAEAAAKASLDARNATTQTSSAPKPEA